MGDDPVVTYNMVFKIVLPEEVPFMFHGTVTELTLDCSDVPSTVRLWQGEMGFGMLSCRRYDW